MRINTRVIVSLIILLFATSSFANIFGDEEVEWSQVPEEAQQTITQYLQDATIEKIEREKEKNKVTVYEVEAKKPNGEKIEIKVEENGTLLEFEID